MNLTSVQRVKDYLGLTTPGSDGVILALIGRASDQVIRWCSRPFQRTVYSGLRLSGYGYPQQQMRMPDDPIISVASLQIGQTVIPVSPDAMQVGYQFDDKYIYLVGWDFSGYGTYGFGKGLRQVLVTFTAGFTGSENGFIPDAPGPYTVTPAAFGYASVDHGVTYVASGLPLTLVGGVPVAGQYGFSQGVYTFAAADKNLQVTMSYDYTPGAVEQAVIELVGGDLKQRDNLGIASKSLRDEHIAYTDKAMSNSVQGLLAQYRRITPV